jgi:hypothetical protein
LPLAILSWHFCMVKARLSAHGLIALFHGRSPPRGAGDSRKLGAFAWPKPASRRMSGVCSLRRRSACWVCSRRSSICAIARSCGAVPVAQKARTKV